MNIYRQNTNYMQKDINQSEDIWDEINEEKEVDMRDQMNLSKDDSSNKYQNKE